MKTLLIGNGLNRCLNTNIDWGNLLNSMKERYHLKNKIHPDISFPMQFECIANHVSKQKHHKNVYTLLKEEIASKVKEIKAIDDKEMVPHSYFLKNKQYQRILTTNYDYVIEDYLKHTYNIVDEDITANQKEIKYSLRRYHKLQDTYIFHIHGEADKPETLCLGYEHYAGSIQYLRSKLALKENSLLLHVLKNKQVTPDIIETYSWAILFLIDDIEIIGLGLDESEIDLWWLISYRAYLKNMHPEASGYIHNTITYHEIISEHSDLQYIKKRKSLFESMDIQYKMHEVKHSNYLEGYYDIAKAIE